MITYHRRSTSGLKSLNQHPCINMRLLNTQTLQFQEFFDSSLPIYAILSHRWDRVEPTYQTFRDSQYKAGPGYKKILDCCLFAAKRGRAWIWIDTVCIDKSSSAELSEAINSMYRWYKNAVECYAYLNDVDIHDSKKALEKSVWFTRGWTLQELLAPHELIFIDYAWNIIGTKKGLAYGIAKLTSISKVFLEEPDTVRRASVAMRMSWASRRETSRLEDRAYSLLGLFGVNMPLLYGEAGNAFHRLQLEILKLSDDESIFAWKTTDYQPEAQGMLAAKPEYFAQSGTIKRYHMIHGDRPPYSMTHKGLKLHLPRHVVEGTTRVVLSLACVSEEDETPFAVILLMLQGDSWARIQGEELGKAPTKTLWTRHDCSYPNKATIYVSQPRAD